MPTLRAAAAVAVTAVDAAVVVLVVVGAAVVPGAAVDVAGAAVLGQAQVCVPDVNTHCVLGCFGITSFNRVDNRDMFVECHQRPAGLRARRATARAAACAAPSISRARTPR